jgi:hypothetical protein
MAAVRIATLMICLLLAPAVAAAQTSTGTDSLAAGSAEKIDQLEQRIRDLEQTRAAQEEATRSIIRQTIEKSGTKINNMVSFGGVFEMLGGKNRDFAGVKEHVLKVNALEFVFEVQTSDWALGNFVVQYTDGSDQLFPTADGTELGVPRFDLDTGWLTLGDTQRFRSMPSSAARSFPSESRPATRSRTCPRWRIRSRSRASRCGGCGPARRRAADTDPRPDSQCARRAAGEAQGPPAADRRLAHLLGYRPLPPVRTEPAVVEQVAPPPPLSLGVLWYNGTTVSKKNPNGAWYPGQHWGATAGYRTAGTKAIDFNVDYNSSIFESRFLESEFRPFLDELGLVPGMAASLKAKWGPVGFVSEWNGAVKKTSLVDDRNRVRWMSPRAWQAGLVYQLGWNSGVESLAAQGTYVAVDYSQTLDMQGVTSIPAGLALRVGALPQKRFLLTVGEWVTDGVRVSFEYQYIKDYPTTDRGTGQSGNGVFGMITYDW